MFLGQFSQYQELQMPSWNEFDVDDDNHNTISNHEHTHLPIDSSTFEPSLISDLDKHVSSMSGFSTASSFSSSSSDSMAINSTVSNSSSVSSVASFTPHNHNQIFDTVHLLDLGTFSKDMHHMNSTTPTNSKNTTSGIDHSLPDLLSNDTSGNSNDIVSPVSSCVSPTMTSTNKLDELTAKNMNLDSNSMKYHLDSNIHYPLFSISESNLIPIKQEILNEDEIDNSQYKESVDKLSDKKIKGPNTDSNIKPFISTTKQTKSGRVKKPMTLVQRKAHNKIERKYRININSKIANLQRLVPSMSEDGVAFEIDGKKQSITRDAPASIDEDGYFTPANNKKLNKSMILDMVTDYLLSLKEECKKKDIEIAQLKEKLSNS
ncbi:hypothetical protein C6P40_002973 [Pichia californica]|uniref:BHLH domain-containing protein n=1 Tax=Pichia californica TaxID=460514 RepID=A0A9P7BEF0_9ASCO|nr:hypothetical protein C6P42_002943 [[Candida] californica]KAG0687035.1 hypothetical protein C6P40_002973 [[Candida] californica]